MPYYCGKTLIELEIIAPTNITLESPFPALKKLKIVNHDSKSRPGSVSVSNDYGLFSKLEELFIFGEINIDWLGRNLPMLQDANLQFGYTANNMFMEFQRNNPQLKKLHT